MFVLQYLRDKAVLKRGSGSFRCPKGREMHSLQGLPVVCLSQTKGILVREAIGTGNISLQVMGKCFLCHFSCEFCNRIIKIYAAQFSAPGRTLRDLLVGVCTDSKAGNPLVGQFGRHGQRVQCCPLSLSCQEVFLLFSDSRAQMF